MNKPPSLYLSSQGKNELELCYTSAWQKIQRCICRPYQRVSGGKLTRRQVALFDQASILYFIACISICNFYICLSLLFDHILYFFDFLSLILHLSPFIRSLLSLSFSTLSGGWASSAPTRSTSTTRQPQALFSHKSQDWIIHAGNYRTELHFHKCAGKKV